MILPAKRFNGLFRRPFKSLMGLIPKIIIAGVALAAVTAGGAIVRSKVPLREPPGPGKRLVTYLSKNHAQTRPDHEFPELRSRTYPMPAEELFKTVTDAVADLGWESVDRDSTRRKIHAVVTTPWLGFKDDVEIVLEASGENATMLQISSRSRVGRADYGANIGHITRLQNALSTHL